MVVTLPSQQLVQNMFLNRPVNPIFQEPQNQRIENIRVLCYNCYYINVGNLIGPKNF